jgi:cation diffusion facilitator CzcD-associated flavoprotein CzcO
MASTLRNPKIVIIGAGMTGILMTIKLREAGITDLEIIEKTDRLGGTWRDNTYPGVACDIPAPSYTYSFEPNPEWSHRFAYGDEIQGYFERVGRKYGVTNSISFNESVTSAVYSKGKWTVETSNGRTIVADFVINCTGILHHPQNPDIAGIETYSGDMFHTAQWDHSIDMKGKRVGIIGTGSTAAQVIPEVAKLAANLTVFQRTPQWILPIGNKEVSEKQKSRYRKYPFQLHLARDLYNWSLSNFLTKAVTGHKIQNAVFSWLCKRNLKKSIKNPVLREKLTPQYRVGCKRIVINDTFYPAIQRDNVDLVTDGIEKMDATGVITKDGSHHELDVLILSTGFNPVAYMRPMNVVGKNEVHINDAWSGKIKNYRSLFMPGFPNNFLMLGPNTPIGNYSVVEMSEVQCNYLLQLVERWRNREFDEIDVTTSTADRFLKYIKAGMSKTVWVGGCNSWYLDADGDPILWPYTWQQWIKEMAQPEMVDFETAVFETPEEEMDESKSQKAVA